MSVSSPAPTAPPATTSATPCAYFSGDSASPITCNGASTCTSDPLGSVVYCNAGTANHTIATKCIPFISPPPTGADASETLRCPDRASPYCVTFSFSDYGSTKYSMFTCDITDGNYPVWATPTYSPTPEPDMESSTPTGAIVGGVVGGVAGLAVIGVSIFLLIRRRKKKTRGQQPLDDGPASDHRSSTATPAMSVAEATSPTFQNEPGVDRAKLSTSAKPLDASNSTDRHEKMQEEGRDRRNSSVAEAQELPGCP